MLIILEGPDGAGKTTLANKILTRIAATRPRDTVTLIHRGPPTSHPLDEYVVPLIDYRPRSGQHVICDRWHIGELVYPAVLERKTKMDDAVFRWIELFLEWKGAVTWVVERSLPDLLRVAAERNAPSSTETAPNLQRAIAGFDATTWPESVHIRHTYATHFSQFDADDIIDTAVTHELRTASTEFITPVGVRRPYAMLVGDVRNCGGTGCNHAVAHRTAGPAFMPYRGTSGHYLMRALPDTIVGAVQLANACDVDDVRKLWEYSHAPLVVTLGVNAHERLVELEVPHAAVPHPQYVRRFHHASARRYGELIYDVIGTERNELKWRP